MTVDPMAAVTSATGSAGSPAAGVDAASSTNTSTTAQSASQAPVAEQSAANPSSRVDLFDYTARHQNKPPMLDTLVPESRAKYLSNPAALGEKVLQRMESFHQRSMDYHNRLQGPGAAQATPGAPATLSGPAGQHVAGTAQPSAASGVSGLQVMFDYAIETTMISNTSSQFVSSVNTLMRGQ